MTVQSAAKNPTRRRFGHHLFIARQPSLTLRECRIEPTEYTIRSPSGHYLAPRNHPRARAASCLSLALPLRQRRVAIVEREEHGVRESHEPDAEVGAEPSHNRECG